jgi:hypothetical protein
MSSWGSPAATPTKLQAGARTPPREYRSAPQTASFPVFPGSQWLLPFMSLEAVSFLAALARPDSYRRAALLRFQTKLCNSILFSWQANYKIVSPNPPRLIFPRVKNAWLLVVRKRRIPLRAAIFNHR